MAKAEKDEQTKYLRRLQVIATGLLILGIIHMFSMARDFLVPVTLAFIIAITFRPLIRRLVNRGLPAWATATALAAFILLGGLSAGYLISGPISGWIANSTEIRQVLATKLKSISGAFQPLANITDEIKKATAPTKDPEVTEVVVKEPALPAVVWIAAYPATYAAMFTGAVVMALFLMASGNLLYEKLINVLPTLTDKKKALRLVQDVENEVSAYLLLHSAINAGVGVSIAVLFYLIGMPSAYLWAFLAFVLNFIPYVGPVGGAAIAGVVGLVVFDTLGMALLAPALYTAVVTLENQFVSPFILGRRLELNHVALILGIAFWGWIWGISGIVLAVPLLVILKVFSSHFEALAAVGEFLTETKENDSGPDPASETDAVKIEKGRS